MKQRGLAMDLRNSVNNKLVLAGASTNKDGQELTIVDQLQAAFSKFDSDGGGFIDEIELGNLLRYLAFIIEFKRKFCSISAFTLLCTSHSAVGIGFRFR